MRWSGHQRSADVSLRQYALRRREGLRARARRRAIRDGRDDRTEDIGVGKGMSAAIFSPGAKESQTKACAIRYLPFTFFCRVSLRGAMWLRCFDRSATFI